MIKVGDKAKCIKDVHMDKSGVRVFTEGKTYPILGVDGTNYRLRNDVGDIDHYWPVGSFSEHFEKVEELMIKCDSTDCKSNKEGKCEAGEVEMLLTNSVGKWKTFDGKEYPINICASYRKRNAEKERLEKVEQNLLETRDDIDKALARVREQISKCD